MEIIFMKNTFHTSCVAKISSQGDQNFRFCCSFRIYYEFEWRGK